jgi:hypothetical protein
MVYRLAICVYNLLSYIRKKLVEALIEGWSNAETWAARESFWESAIAAKKITLYRNGLFMNMLRFQPFFVYTKKVGTGHFEGRSARGSEPGWKADQAGTRPLLRPTPIR